MEQIQSKTAQQIEGISEKLSRVSIQNADDNKPISFQTIRLCLNKGILLETRASSSSGEDQHSLIEFINHREGCVIRRDNEYVMIEDENFIAMAVEESTEILGKSYVEQFGFFVGQPDIERSEQQKLDEESMIANAQRVWSNLRHKLKIGTLRCEFPIEVDQLMALLSCIELESLEGIIVNFRENVQEFGRLTDSEYWKQLKKLSFKASTYPIRQIANIPYVGLENVTLSVEDVKAFVEGALKQGDKYEWLCIPNVKYEDHDAVCEYLSQFALVNDEASVYELKIPNSEEILEINALSEVFSIFLQSLQRKYKNISSTS